MSEPRNHLGDETSPYLLQHRDNPVHWWPWGEAALAEAKATNRPILLSIGYSACHWCHVMAHESFENEAVAAQMNRDYVNIKVDREERPDLDAIYQKALSLMGEHGGWPLTMFLSPDGRPFWGGTYFPPKPAYGRPSFTDVLTQLARIWRDDTNDIAAQGAALVDAMAKDEREQLTDGLSIKLIGELSAGLLEYMDTEAGGLKGAPKFPMPFLYDLLWRVSQKNGNAALRAAVLKTLQAICLGGIYDHVGGGFARYSTDAQWLAPHFEKMLYDNAQLVDLLTLLWRDTGSELFATRVAETVEWLDREMMTKDKAFASALDADSEGVEGKFYVWTEAEIDHLLGADAPAFKAAYDVTPGGNWDGHAILSLSRTGFRVEDEEHFAHCRDVLLQGRELRTRPGCDDKVLTDWNGLMIAALARAGAAFKKPDWVQRAERAFAAVIENATWHDDQGRARLGHAWRAGRLQRTAMLDDYANMANAALALFETTADPNYLARARGWVDLATALYWDEDAGGYFFTASDAETLILRTKTANDAASPSGNGAMVQALARLFYITGARDDRTRAGATVAALSVEALRGFPHACTLLSGFLLLEEAVQVVIVGHADSNETKALLAAAHSAAEPGLIVTVIEDGAGLPAGHPAQGKAKVNGRVTAYVCRGPVCEAPVTNAADLTAALV